jgi:hypothetical protein
MSRTKPTEGELAELQVECPKCGAKRWDWCKPVWAYSGKHIEFEMVATRPPPKSLHTARFNAATEAGLLPLP